MKSLKRNFWKKTAAGIMAVMIVSGYMPVQPLSQVFDDLVITANAEGTTENLGGYNFTIESDSEGNYYKIDCPDALNALATYVNADNNCSGKRFKQTADITLTGTFTPIGSIDNSTNMYDSRWFSGTYDGGNHTITGLSVNNPCSTVGLFGFVSNGTLKNIIVVEPNIMCSNKNGNALKYAGAIAGRISASTISGCYVINPTLSFRYISYHRYSGVICSGFYNGSTIINCCYYAENDYGIYGDWGLNNTLSNSDRTYKLTLDSGITTDTTAKFSYNGTNYYAGEINLSSSTTVPTGYLLSYKVNGVQIEDSSFTINSNANVTALNVPISYTVTFDGNRSTDGTMNAQGFVYDTTQTLTANAFSRTGYNFNSWNTQSNGKGTSYTDEQSVQNLTTENNGSVTLYAQWIPDSAHFSQNGDTYTIYDEIGWGVFCDRIQNGETFSGKTVVLDKDITVSTMAGDQAKKHTFNGTFDGQGNTLTFNATAADNYVAPFAYLKGTESAHASISNLKVNTTITSEGYRHIAGLVAVHEGYVDITNCTADVKLSAKVGANNPSDLYPTGLVSQSNGNLTVKGCKVTGSISTNGKYAAGYVGIVQGSAEIENSISSVTINSSTNIYNANNNTYSKDGTHSGFIATQSTDTKITIKGCVFNGKLLSNNGTTNCAGFVGWRNSTVNLENCIYAPDEVESDETEITSGAAFVRNGSADNNCYYTRTLGTAQGKQAHTITAGENVTVDLAENSTVGVAYNGAVYAANEEPVELALGNTTPNGYTFEGYTVSAGTLADGTLTMPDADVTVSANFDANTYSVVFDKNANDATGAMSAQNFTYDEAAKALNTNVFTRTGYAFAGWAAEPTGAVVYADGESVQNLIAEEGGTVTLYAKWTPYNYKTRVVKNIDHCSVTVKVNNEESEIAHYGDTITVTVIPDEGYSFKGISYDNTVLQTKNSNNRYSSTFTMPNKDVDINVEIKEDLDPVTYIDENGKEQTITEYTLLTGNEAAVNTIDCCNQSVTGIILSGGTYVVDGNLSYSVPLIFHGDTVLILKDGAKLKIDAEPFGLCCIDYINDIDYSLSICGQNKSNGELNVTSVDWSGIIVKNYLQNGGKVSASAVYDSSIEVINDFTLNNGELKLTSGSNEAFHLICSNGNVTFNGGTATLNTLEYDGIYARNSVIFNGGVVTAITKGLYSGIEAKDGSIILNGGTVLASSYNKAVEVTDNLTYTDGKNIYTGTITGNDLTAISGKRLKSGQLVIINSVDINGIRTQTIVSAEKYANSDYTVSAPHLDGYEFKGWKVNGGTYTAAATANAEVESLVKAGTSVTVEVIYEKKNVSYAVSVTNGKLSTGKTNGEIQVSKLVTVKANAAPSGKTFSYWLRNGKKVSTNATYSFYMPSENVALTAVYEDTATPAGTAIIESVTASSNKLSFVSVLNIPKNCKFVKGGLVATNNAFIGVNVDANNATFVKLSTKATANSKNVKYTWTKSGVGSGTWYVRGYLVYKDASGTEHTVYSDAVKANKNGVIS